MAQREPVEITSRSAGRRAVVVSPEFFDRAVKELEDQADIRGAAAARSERGEFPTRNSSASLTSEHQFRNITEFQSRCVTSGTGESSE